jgi:pimeloyl-ACP methyl ester carboxylesterase
MTSQREHSSGTWEDVALFGARGSFEPYLAAQVGMGPTVFGVSQRVIALLEARGSALRVKREGVSYSANAWNYGWSRARGAVQLNDLLAQAASRCPEQRFVLIGLSQGADLVRRTLRRTTPEVSDRIAAVVLIGDPTRRPSDPWNHGTHDPRSGVLAWWASKVDPILYPKMWGYTAEGDEVAANHRRFTGIFRSGSHTSYEENRDGVQDRAAAFIVDQLLDRQTRVRTSP